MCTNLFKASVVLALLAILLGMPLLLTPHRIRPSTIALIKLGMSKMECEILLGVKPGHYDGYDYAGVQTQRDHQIWCSRNCAIVVIFDGDGRVESRMCFGSWPVSWLALCFAKLESCWRKS